MNKEQLFLITAIIRPNMLDNVQNALHQVGVNGLTATDSKGFGRQKGHTEIYRGAEYRVNYVPKTKVEILVDEATKDRALEALIEATNDGKPGCGKIWITKVEQVIRIRTGETGVAAL